MKIFYFMTSLKNKGPSVQTVRLAIEMRRRGHKVSIIVLKNKINQKFTSSLTKNGIEVIPLISKKGLCFLLSGQIVIHSTGILPDVLCFLLARKKTWVTTIRNVPQEDFPKKFNPIIGAILASIHVFVLQRCLKPVACSSYIHQILSIKMANLTCINNAGPVPIPDFKIDVKKPKDWLILGSLIERKNNKPIIQTFEKYPQLGMLHVVGDGAERNKLEDMARFSENIKFYGEISEPSNLLKQCNFVISNSVSEGMPNSILEALTYGCYCFLSDIEPHRFLKTLHPNQITITPLNAKPSDLYNKLVSISCVYEQKLQREAFGLSKELHIENIGSKYEELYKY